MRDLTEEALDAVAGKRLATPPKAKKPNSRPPVSLRQGKGPRTQINSPKVTMT
jgi:hypothetical protein